ncbi:MAG: hypothetical protein RLO46_05145 [Pseudomonadales bacterium]
MTDRANIERFNTVTLHLITRLYESFPTPYDITDENIIDFGFEPVPADATAEEAWEIGTSLPHVLSFLQEEGFLRYQPDPNGREQFWRVRLTLKGLTIMRLPTALEPGSGKSLYERAKESLGSLSKAAGTEAGKHVVAEIFKLAVFGLRGGG